MRFAAAPEALLAILSEPGQVWTEEQVLVAFHWVFCLNLKRVTRIAAITLGSRLADQAEDLCQEFAMRRFRRIVRLYDPARGTLDGFVVFCLQRYCRAQARPLRRAAARTAPLDDAVLNHLQGRRTPESRFLQTESRRNLRHQVQQGMARIGGRASALLQMELDDCSMEERAHAIGRNENATKTAACRARQRLGRELLAGGLTLSAMSLSA